MNIESLTIKEAREIAAMFGSKSNDNPFTIGDNWFFRTVTHHLVGEIKAVGDKEIVLKGGTVMWIADDGRFSDAIKTGDFNETEPYGTEDVVIGRGSIIDATRMKTNIVVVQK